MSRKRKAPVRKVYPDPKFRSELVSKFINCIMYDGKRSTAEKILYDALDKIKETNKEDPLKTFNDAIGNVKISTPNEVAIGDEAIYYVEKELVRLSGNVKITRGISQLNGSIAEVNLKTGRSRLLSNAQLDGNTKVQGLFSRNSKQTK